MFISLCGGLCAGKQSVAEYLIRFHNFRELQIRHDQENSSFGFSASDGRDTSKPCSPPSPSPSPADETSDPTAATAVTTASGKQIAGKRCNHRTSAWEAGPAASRSVRREPLVFDSVDELKAYVVPRWRERFVTTHLWDEDAFEKFLILPFFFLVSVDAPISVRWKRFVERCAAHNPPTPPPSLESFVRWNDKHIFDPATGIARLMYSADVRLMNPSSSLSDLHASLGVLSPDLLDEQRLRPRWDAYFMQLASLAALRSNCMKRRVGCVLVRSKRVISTGYNGTPRNVTNCNEGGCPRCNGTSGAGAGAALSTCLCLHAEENALLEAGRERVGEGAILYCNTCPCLTCSVKIAQLGIDEVVYAIGYNMDEQTARVLQEAGVKLRQFSPPRKGLIYLHEPDTADFMEY